MKKFLLGLFLGFVLSVSGCSLFEPKTVHDYSKVQDDPYKTTQYILDEVNIAVTAAANVLKQNYNSGTISNEDFKNYREKVKEAANMADSAQVLLNKGNWTDARVQLTLAQNLVKVVQKKLVEIQGQ